MDTPFFSITIPTYNSSKTLSSCLDSLLNQSFTDFEILILDGGSTDDTLSIIREYSKRNLVFRCVSENDMGIYDAMNKGIELAKGKWMYFLGSDDTLYDNEVLNSVFKEINLNPFLDVIYGDVYSTKYNGLYDGEFTDEKIFNQNICHQALFFKRTVFKKIGMFNRKYRGCADWDHNMHWFLSKKINKKYFSRIIAVYADGGYSSLHGDNYFIEYRNLKFLYYARKRLSFQLKYSSLSKELKASFKSKKYKKVFSILYYAPLILLS